MNGAPLRLGLFSPSPVLWAWARPGRPPLVPSIEVVRVASSLEQFSDLSNGRYDLVLTSPDNVLSYRYDDANLLGRRLDVRILAGVDRGMGLSLLARDGLRSPADLAGCRVGVDVPESGFALALFALLARHGLVRDRDYEIISLGATPRRLRALLAGECAATLLNAGYDLQAEAAGARRVAAIAREFPPYLGTVLATTADRLSGRGTDVAAFVSGWRQARTAVFDDGGDELLAAFATAELGLSAADARRYAATALDPAEGLLADGAIEPEALATLVALRAGGGPGATSLAAAVAADRSLVVTVPARSGR